MKTRFYKMHGIGNDYIYFDCFDGEIPEPEKVAIKYSDRHFGIGGDGVILICKSDVADGRMRMFNADGSEGKMCGNGIRCVGTFLYDFGKVGKKTKITVETLSGIRRLELFPDETGKVRSVKVDMGAAILEPEKIPTTFQGEPIVAKEVKIGGEPYRITCVSMGNPHCVVFQDPDTVELAKVGPLFEKNEIFPEQVNTEFVRVISPTELKMRVWERGSGETWACGTGTCAAVVAATLNGYCPKNTDVTVHLLGGDLVIRYTDETVFMTGPAELVFSGEVEI